MAKGIYLGIDSLSRKVKKMYLGIEGVARKVKKGYVGVNGLARLFFTLGTMFRYVTKITILGEAHNGVKSSRYGGCGVGDYYIHFADSRHPFNGCYGMAVDMRDHTTVPLDVKDSGDQDLAPRAVGLRDCAIATNVIPVYNANRELSMYDSELTRSVIASNYSFNCAGSAPLGDLAMFYESGQYSPRVLRVTSEGTMENDALVPGYLYSLEPVDQFGKYNVVYMMSTSDGHKIYSISEELVVEEIYSDPEAYETYAKVFATRDYVFTSLPAAYDRVNYGLNVFDDELTHIGTTELISRQQYARRYIPMGSQLVAMGGRATGDSKIPYLDYIDEELVQVFQDPEFEDQFSPTYGDAGSNKDMGFGKYGEDKVCVYYGRNTDGSVFWYGTTFAIYENV